MSNILDSLSLDVLGIIISFLDFESIHSLIKTLYDDRKKVYLIKNLGIDLKKQLDEVKNKHSNIDNSKYSISDLRILVNLMLHMNKCSALLKSTLEDYKLALLHKGESLQNDKLDNNNL